MPSIVFKKSGLSDLTIETGRVYPVRRPVRVNQARYLTESMNPKVVSYGSTVEFIVLELAGLPRDNYDGTVNGIKTWLSSSVINWSAASFTLVDERGDTHTVRYWADEFDMPRVYANRYSTTLTLLKEA